MKEVHIDEITSALEKLFIEANYELPQNVLDTLEKSIDKEESLVGKEVFRELIRNATLAREERIPICQDTGIGMVFIVGKGAADKVVNHLKAAGENVHVIGEVIAGEKNCVYES